MKALQLIKRIRVAGTLLVTLLLASSMFATVANASEIMPMGGTETLPYGYYEIGSFTFFNNNLTPVKTVGGTGKLQFGVQWRRSPLDTGIGNIKLYIEVRDASTQRVLCSKTLSGSGDYTFSYDTTPDLYVTAGSKLQVFLDARSAGQSNGNFRTAEIGFISSILY